MREKLNFIQCPKCKCKTKVAYNLNTVLKDFPLYCTHCKRSSVINFPQMEMVRKNVSNAPHLSAPAHLAGGQQAAEYIAKIRTKLKLSQRQLAKLVGVAHTTISRIERKLTTPKASTLAKIASIF